MQVIRWQEATAPQEQALREHMKSDGLSPHAWSNGPHDQYAIHTHTYEKVLYCVQGSIRFVMHDYPKGTGKDTPIDLSPGDCLILPAGIRHSAQVGSQGVTCLEAAR